MPKTRPLETTSKLALISTFRSAFIFGLIFMGGILFAHRYHEADRRIDERRMLVESTRRVALEVDRRIGGSLEQLQTVAVHLLPSDARGRGRVGLPTGVEALWVGTWPVGARVPEWLATSLPWEGSRFRGPELPEQVLVRVREARESERPVLIRDSSGGRLADLLAVPVSLQGDHRARELVLARIDPSFLFLGSEDLKAQRDSLSRMEFSVHERSAISVAGGTDGTRIAVPLGRIPSLEVSGVLRGDAVWQTRMEIERNGLWFLLISALLFWVGGLLRGTLGKARLMNQGPGAPEDSSVRGSSLGSATRLPSRGEFERTGTRELKAGMEVFGGISERSRSKIERKEVAVLHGRLVEPDLWTSEGRVSPQEVADTVFEVLAGVREALQAEGVTPEIRLFEEGAFSAFFEIWNEGQGGLAAPLKAVLAIRRAMSRINGLRNTDGHREVRMMMGLRTGVLVRDARALPVRYSGVTLREAQDLARAAGALGVDCLIAPMGDQSRGEPLIQLAHDFILSPISTGRFTAQAEGGKVSLLVLEGTRLKDEQGVEHEAHQLSGMKFEVHPLVGFGSEDPAKGGIPLLKLEYFELSSRIESTPLAHELNASTQEKPARKSEAS